MLYALFGLKARLEDRLQIPLTRRSADVGGGGDGVAAAVGRGPGQDPRFRLLEGPGGRLFDLVVLPAQGRQIARAGPAALAVGDGVVDITADGGAAAAGGRAGAVAGFDQVADGVGGLVAAGLVAVAAA